VRPDRMIAFFKPDPGDVTRLNSYAMYSIIPICSNHYRHI